MIKDTKGNKISTETLFSGNKASRCWKSSRVAQSLQVFLSSEELDPVSVSQGNGFSLLVLVSPFRAVTMAGGSRGASSSPSLLLRSQLVPSRGIPSRFMALVCGLCIEPGLQWQATGSSSFEHCRLRSEASLGLVAISAKVVRQSLLPRLVDKTVLDMKCV